MRGHEMNKIKWILAIVFLSSGCITYETNYYVDEDDTPTPDPINFWDGCPIASYPSGEDPHRMCFQDPEFVEIGPPRSDLPKYDLPDVFEPDYI